MINFICSNDYQVLQAALYCKLNLQPVCIFCINDKAEYNTIDDITFVYTSRDVLTKPLKQLTDATEADLTLLSVIYDDAEELHVFDNIEYLYNKGRDNVILHDNGDSSYILNEYNMPGELDPYTVSYTVYKLAIDDIRNALPDYDIDKYKEELISIFCKAKGLGQDISDNTVLFIHNAPDDKYTEEEKSIIEEDLKLLLNDIKQAGYKIHFKTHHKRIDSELLELLADNVISNIPVELVPNIDKYSHIISIRNNYLLYLKHPSIINALTQEAVTKCKKNWKYVYLRGIFKIRKRLNLI